LDFRYVFLAGIPALASPSRATACFDPSSYLPVATVSDAEINDYRLAITMRYRFDPAMRIERPEEQNSTDQALPNSAMRSTLSEVFAPASR
jgi:hypothetical protein